MKRDKCGSGLKRSLKPTLNLPTETSSDACLSFALQSNSHPALWANVIQSWT
jgi:hypothetical protein